MHKIQFVPECFAETEMVRVLFADLGYINHGEGIHSVSKILKKEDVQNYVNVGFIDKDKKNTPPYFDEFTTLEETPALIFKKHPTTNDYIIITKPAIDTFILSQIAEIKKQPSHYNLPDDLKRFCKRLKSMRIQSDEGYKRMINDLKNAKTSWVSFIMNKISELQRI